MKIRIAQVKAYPQKGALTANSERLMDILAKVARAEPDVVITPEGFLDGYVATLETVDAAQMHDYAIDPCSSKHAQLVSRWAKKNSAWVILGCTRVDGSVVHNSALVYDRAGSLAGTYDKGHLQMHDRKYIAGTQLPVFKSDFGLFGVMICADRRWPETVRTLALQGARIILNPTYGMSDELNLCMMRTRSYESEVFIAFTHPRQALITDPSGSIICNNENDSETFAVTDIDLTEADRARMADLAHLRDRRPEIYRL